MAVKKQIYIEAELDWLEGKLQEWKAYIDANPYAELKDRMSYRDTKNGGVVPMCVATIEQQQKSLRDATKEMLILLEQLNRLREMEEEKKKAVKGGGDRPTRMS